MNQLSLFDFSALETPKKKQEKEKSSFEIYADDLKDYLPEKSLTEVCNLLVEHDVFLKITNYRQTKLGDYMPPQNGKGHRISINCNLNKYAFLITMLHEIAHLVVWKNFGRKVKPHGREWKHELRKFLQPLIHQKNFPQEINLALNNYLQNPSASSCTDENLYKTLKIFDKKKTIYLEDIPIDTNFSIAGNTAVFRKEKKIRKRFLCKQINSKRKYLVSPIAEVVVVEN